MAPPLRRLLPLAAHEAQEIVARCRIFRDSLVAARTVVAHRRSIEQKRWPLLCFLNGIHQAVRGRDAARVNFFLLNMRPPLGCDGFAGKIDYAIRAVQGRFPISRGAGRPVQPLLFVRGSIARRRVSEKRE